VKVTFARLVVWDGKMAYLFGFKGYGIANYKANIHNKGIVDYT
jgi:hypothetical protein